MRKSMNCFLPAAVAAFVLTSVSPAFAQDTPKAEVSIGYNWLAAKESGDDDIVDTEWEKFPKGFYGDIAANISDTLSIVGQYTGNFKTFDDDSKLTVQTFMGGIRGSSPGNVRGFGQVLLGGATVRAEDELFAFDESETNLALQLGAGVNVLAGGRVGFRLGVDYLRLFAKDDSLLFFEDVNGFRFNVGVTFGIGSR